MTLDELTGDGVLDALLLRMYGPHLFDEHHSVLVSQWSKYYFMLLWKSALRRWPSASMAWESACLHVGKGGLPERLELLGEARNDLFDELVPGHLSPLITFFSALAKTPAGVFWSNAGDALDQALQRISQEHSLSSLLVARQLPGGQANPLRYAVHRRPDGRRTVRACCLAWQVPGIGYCEHCPLSKTA